MIDPKHPAIQEIIRQVHGKPVRAAEDSCSQGGPSSYVIDCNENPLCGYMYKDEAHVIANVINLLVENNV